ncbi:MAG TPA: cardiolipin synthase [Planctomycetaceae bacterium]|nr:cardiolipin synthase [Blastopirellula sp.]HAY82184.1 cardiolipin synthase [Planctomycetaceae bacterium]
MTTLTWILIAIHFAIEVVLLLRVMLRPHREPASRIAWAAAITSLPVAGIVAYVLFGEVSIGRRRAARRRAAIESLADLPAFVRGDEAPGETAAASVPAAYEHLFRMGASISGMEAIGGNSAELLADSNQTIDAMVADIDAARDHVHVLFYIWLPDKNGAKVAAALQRAAERGVACRAIVDSLGSRAFLDSEYAEALREAGVQLAVALPIGNPLLRPLRGRIDLRNHRKVVVIDGGVTYCGSQNCADPEFLVKAKYAPWVDAVMRFEGPIAQQNQQLFVADWMTYSDEPIKELLVPSVTSTSSGLAAQVIATGPTNRHAAMPQMFETLIHAARRELLITTPYFVPDESMMDALCAAAYRGVKTSMVFPARNDSWVVAAASRSYYETLLQAGVIIHEFQGGLLHAKTLTLDGEVTLLGSANMDRRSFDLNYENNILFYDPQATDAVVARQQHYIAQSELVTREMVAAWSVPRRLWNNTLATLGPIL